MSFDDASGKVQGIWQGNTNVAFSIQVLAKDPSQSPREDEPPEYFSDGALAGQPMNETDPHPTPHKTRLNIHLRKGTQDTIMANDGIGDPKYSFLCGNVMGSYLESRLR